MKKKIQVPQEVTKERPKSKPSPEEDKRNLITRVLKGLDRLASEVDRIFNDDYAHLP